MLKRVDVAVYNAFMEGENLAAGVSVLDLKADGVGYALDDNNAALLTQDMQDTVNAAAGKIKAGELTVHDFMSDNACPVE
jgi:basic membrane protein A